MKKILKTSSRTFLVACVMIALVLVGCSGSTGTSAATDTATEFLETLYTVQEYRSKPQSQEDIDALSAEFAPYMTEDALDTLLMNRHPLDASTAAEEIGATIAVLEVVYEPMPDTEGYYMYTAVLEVTTAGEIQEIDATGKIILNEDGLISYFAPDTTVTSLLRG